MPKGLNTTNFIQQIFVSTYKILWGYKGERLLCSHRDGKDKRTLQVRATQHRDAIIDTASIMQGWECVNFNLCHQCRWCKP